MNNTELSEETKAFDILCNKGIDGHPIITSEKLKELDTLKKQMKDKANSLQLQKVIDLLNNELKLSDYAIQDVLDYRTTYIGKDKSSVDKSKLVMLQDSDGKCTLSALGLINSILEELTGKRIMACYSNEDILLKFQEYKGL